jgi:hypothetical protein
VPHVVSVVEPLRLTVDAAAFGSWRLAVPGLPLPTDDPLAGPGRRATVPPFVAASLAVHGQAATTVTLAVGTPSVTVVVHLSTAGGLAALLARARLRAAPGVPGAPGRSDAPDGGEDWVQVGLLPIDQAVQELRQWLPGTEPGPIPDGASLRMHYARWGPGAAAPADGGELAHWVGADGAWQVRGEPEGPAARARSGRADPDALAEALHLVLQPGQGHDG